MRHPLGTLTVGALLAATLVLRADEGIPGSRIETAPRRAVPISGPLPVGVEADVYCAGYLGDVEEPFTGTVVAAEKELSQSMFMTGDILYIDRGAADGVQAGMEFTIVRPDRVIYRYGSVSVAHGRIYLTPARLRVICAQERSSITEIVYGCADVEVGDHILPFEPLPVPLVRRTSPVTACDTPNGKPIGHIVHTKDAVTPIGADTVVFLDLGESDGLNPGDFLTVYRPSARAEGVRTVLGEAAILTTRGRSSVAIITLSADNMTIGDSVEVK